MFSPLSRIQTGDVLPPLGRPVSRVMALPSCHPHPSRRSGQIGVLRKSHWLCPQSMLGSVPFTSPGPPPDHVGVSHCCLPPYSRRLLSWRCCHSAPSPAWPEQTLGRPQTTSLRALVLSIATDALPGLGAACWERDGPEGCERLGDEPVLPPPGECVPLHAPCPHSDFPCTLRAC